MEISDSEFSVLLSVGPTAIDLDVDDRWGRRIISRTFDRVITLRLNTTFVTIATVPHSVSPNSVSEMIERLTTNVLS